MTGKSRFLSAIIFFVVGIILIVMHDRVDLMKWIVVILGIGLILPGLINVAVSAFSKKAERESLEGASHKSAYVTGLVISVFCIALGVAMLIAPDFFAGVMAYLFAAILIAVGVFHILTVGYLAKPYVMPFYFYVVPVLLVAAGVVILFTGVRGLNSIVLLIVGIGLVCSAVNSLLEYVGTHPVKRLDAGEKPSESGERHPDENEAVAG